MEAKPRKGTFMYFATVSYKLLIFARSLQLLPFILWFSNRRRDFLERISIFYNLAWTLQGNFSNRKNANRKIVGDAFPSLHFGFQNKSAAVTSKTDKITRGFGIKELRESTGKKLITIDFLHGTYWILQRKYKVLFFTSRKILQPKTVEIRTWNI